jgi:hypothetical protein
MDTPDSAWSIICLSLVCLVSSALCGEEKASPNSPSTFIIAEPNVVKGFPVVVKVRARGPQVVPELGIFDEEAQISVVLASKTGGEKYTIASTKGRSMDLRPKEGGGFVSDGTHLFRVFLPANVERTMIFDLCSLGPEGHRKGMYLHKVPPGEYEVSIRFPDGVTSNTIPMQLLAPSDVERQFLEKTAGPARHRSKFGPLVSWSSFLRAGREITEDDLGKLGEVARSQLQFHVLLSRVIAPESPVKDIRIEPLKSIAVPKYLEPEKEFLFLEMEKASGRRVAEEVNALLQKDPGLRWRVDELSAHGMNLLVAKFQLEWRRKTRRPVGSSTAPAAE